MNFQNFPKFINKLLSNLFPARGIILYFNKSVWSNNLLIGSVLTVHTSLRLPDVHQLLIIFGVTHANQKRVPKRHWILRSGTPNYSMSLIHSQVVPPTQKMRWGKISKYCRLIADTFGVTHLKMPLFKSRCYTIEERIPALMLFDFVHQLMMLIFFAVCFH